MYNYYHPLRCLPRADITAYKAEKIAMMIITTIITLKIFIKLQYNELSSALH